MQISIADDDRDYLQFLWFDDIFEEEPKIVRSRFARVVFGVNSPPFLLNGTIRKHANTYLDIDPEFVKKFTKSFYVDDCITGENSIEKALELYKKLKMRFMEGKWRTNDPADIITRSNTCPSALAANDLWWEGPSFLQNSKEHWKKERKNRY